MKYFLFIAAISSFFLLFSSCGIVETEPKFTNFDTLSYQLIPKPIELDTFHSAFSLTKLQTIYFESDFSDDFHSNAINYLEVFTKMKLVKSEKPDYALQFRIEDSLKNNPESYSLSIKETNINISAGSEEGAFRGLQTLVQLILQQPVPFLLAMNIYDKPVYPYRGMMLDVARHFFEVKDVKRLIDLLSLYKINYLHLHLSDDQGWRIEIKKWPKLTEIGGSSEVGGGPGGYYTQEDYKEIVSYAAKNFITIIPEIDMPGHTNAALASYPELNCDGNATELYTGTRVGFSSLCVEKDIIYQFIEDVVSEIAELTPGPYFHIGGDESHSTEKSDYIYFVNRVKQIVYKYDKKMMGWDEIAQSDVDKKSVIHFWRHPKFLKAGVTKGSEAVVSYAPKAYLDMKYDSTTQLGLDWAGTIEIDSAYLWSIESFTGDTIHPNILGIEGPLWSETIDQMVDLEYLAFPRIIAYSEIGWTPVEMRNWDDFSTRLKGHYAVLDSLNVNYYKSPVLE